MEKNETSRLMFCDIEKSSIDQIHNLIFIHDCDETDDKIIIQIL